MMSFEAFLQLSSQQVADLVRESGPKVVVFPINGTRRWFMLEYGQEHWDDPLEAYVERVGGQTIALNRLIFDHGIHTLLIPVLGREMLETRENYMEQLGARGLAWLASHPDFLSFYQEYGVRVRFYGDYRPKIQSTPYAYLLDMFDEVMEKTSRNDRHRLFYGVFADDATSTLACLSIRYHQERGVVPDKQTLIQLYYGEPLSPADIFIGFDKFSVYDYPLLSCGQEDLYFTAAPSLYMTERQLRAILYDYLYLRRASQLPYETLTAQAWKHLRQFYGEYRHVTFGTGRLENGVWLPHLGRD
ncbi:MAG: diterpene synthase [Anaerolineales bacterium]